MDYFECDGYFFWKNVGIDHTELMFVNKHKIIDISNLIVLLLNAGLTKMNQKYLALTQHTIVRKVVYILNLNTEHRERDRNALCRACKFSKLTFRDVLSPTKTHLLILFKQCHQLESKHSNTRAYGGHLISMEPDKVPAFRVDMPWVRCRVNALGKV